MGNLANIPVTQEELNTVIEAVAVCKGMFLQRMLTSETNDKKVFIESKSNQLETLWWRLDIIRRDLLAENK